MLLIVQNRKQNVKMLEYLLNRVLRTQMEVIVGAIAPVWKRFVEQYLLVGTGIAQG